MPYHAKAMRHRASKSLRAQLYQKRAQLHHLEQDADLYMNGIGTVFDKWDGVRIARWKVNLTGHSKASARLAYASLAEALEWPVRLTFHLAMRTPSHLSKTVPIPFI